MADKYEKSAPGRKHYENKGLVGKEVFATDPVWAHYERRAKKKGWKLRPFMTWLLSKKL